MLFVRAANEGRTIVEMFPRERITEDFDALADRILGTPSTTSAKQPFKLFGRQKEVVRA
jgi:Flp pilus assembly CpaE family ATPase